MRLRPPTSSQAMTCWHGFQRARSKEGACAPRCRRSRRAASMGAPSVQSAAQSVPSPPGRCGARWRAVCVRLANPALTCRLAAPQGAAAAKPTHAAPSRTNVAGDSRLVPLQIDDGDDRGKVYQRKAKASAAALPDWLVGPPPAPPSETVVVQSNRAWIGTRLLAVCACTCWSEQRHVLDRRRPRSAELPSRLYERQVRGSALRVAKPSQRTDACLDFQGVALGAMFRR